jgi:pSer/pThr/pTyr-binding forkhead associated (FHA) protein
VWINGARVYQSILRTGDTLRLGATDLRYEVLVDPPKATQVG